MFGSLHLFHVFIYSFIIHKFIYLLMFDPSANSFGSTFKLHRETAHLSSFLPLPLYSKSPSASNLVDEGAEER